MQGKTPLQLGSLAESKRGLGLPSGSWMGALSHSATDGLSRLQLSLRFFLLWIRSMGGALEAADAKHQVMPERFSLNLDSGSASFPVVPVANSKLAAHNYPVAFD